VPISELSKTENLHLAHLFSCHKEHWRAAVVHHLPTGTDENDAMPLELFWSVILSVPLHISLCPFD